MNDMARISVSSVIKTPIGDVYVAPNGVAFSTWRIGEIRNGVVVSEPELSRDECGLAGVEYREMKR